MSNKPRKKKPFNRQQILGQKGKRRFLDVPIPEWDGEVRLQCLTANEVFEYEKNVKIKGKIDERRALGLLVIQSIVDENGVLQFKEKDIDELLSSDAVVMTTLGQAALKLNKIKEEEIKKIVKNL